MDNTTYVIDGMKELMNRDPVSDSILHQKIWRNPMKYLGRALRASEYLGVRYDGKRSTGGCAEVFHLHGTANAPNLVLKVPYPHINIADFTLEGKVQRYAYETGVETPEIIAQRELFGRPALLMEERGMSISHGHGVRYSSCRIAQLGSGIAKQLILLHETVMYPDQTTLGVLHNDIKPDNVLIDSDGKVVLIDFAATGPVHRRQERMMTIPYTAPERIFDSFPLDGRADVFSLGATLYELAAGEKPYPTPERSIPDHRKISHFTRVMDQTHTPLGERMICSIDNKDFCMLIDAMLKYNPHARPSMGEVKRELKNYQ